MADNVCVSCGEVIPEGRQVCPNCEGRRIINEKQKAKENINRALGWLEGISYEVSDSAAACIGDAVALIEESLKVVFEDG